MNHLDYMEQKYNNHSLTIDACSPPQSCFHTPFPTPAPTPSHTRDVSWLINMGSEWKAFLACCTLHFALYLLLMQTVLSSPDFVYPMHFTR